MLASRNWSQAFARLNQSQRVAGGRGVEDNMVISSGRLRVTNQRRELVKGRDLHGAGAGKLLFDALQKPHREGFRASVR